MKIHFGFYNYKGGENDMRKFFCCLIVVLVLAVFGSCSSDNIRKFGHSLNGLSKWNLSGYSAKAQQQFNSSVDEFISSASDFSLEEDKEDIKHIISINSKNSELSLNFIYLKI